MIQFNLLPDIKIKYLKTQRLKRVVFVLSLAVIAFSAGMMVILLAFVQTQKQHLDNLNKDIKTFSQQLNDTPDLTKILSIQNQLNTLPDLYNGRPATDRLPGYLDQTTPVGVFLEAVSVDFSASTLELTGNSAKFDLVNSFADTLKYTEYDRKSEGAVIEKGNAFAEVVFDEFSRDETEASFVITLKFNPIIFNISEDVSLRVPELATTRATAPGAALFMNDEDDRGSR